MIVRRQFFLLECLICIWKSSFLWPWHVANECMGIKSKWRLMRLGSYQSLGPVRSCDPWPLGAKGRCGTGAIRLCPHPWRYINQCSECVSSHSTRLRSWLEMGSIVKLSNQGTVHSSHADINSPRAFRTATKCVCFRCCRPVVSIPTAGPQHGWNRRCGAGRYRESRNDLHCMTTQDELLKYFLFVAEWQWGQ